MDISGSSEVWLAENPKTREQRVFKFAADGARLKGLKREITISRFLRESLGDRPEFVRILEWNFESPHLSFWKANTPDRTLRNGRRRKVG